MALLLETMSLLAILVICVVLVLSSSTGTILILSDIHFGHLENAYESINREAAH